MPWAFALYWDYACFLRFQNQKTPPAAASTATTPAIHRPLVPVSSVVLVVTVSAGS